MVVLRLFQPHSVRRIFVSGSPNTQLVMQFYQCQSLSWNPVSSNQSSVGGISSVALRKLDLRLENKAQNIERGGGLITVGPITSKNIMADYGAKKPQLRLLIFDM